MKNLKFKALLMMTTIAYLSSVFAFDLNQISGNAYMELGLHTKITELSSDKLEKKLIIIPNIIKINTPKESSFNIIKFQNNKKENITLIFPKEKIKNNAVYSYSFIPNKIIIKPNQEQNITLKQVHKINETINYSYSVKIIYGNKEGVLILNNKIIEME